MADFRTLCSDLLDALYQCDWPDGERFYALTKRARTALKQDHFLDTTKKVERPSLDRLMAGMPEQWTRRWCDAEACSCMGCANRSGGIAAHGYTRSDHARWLLDNPRSGKD